MKISQERRAEINRDNAKKSTGPRSPEGRKASSQNARKHLLRAETLAFDEADAARLRDKLFHWMEFYQPETPAEVEYVNFAVTAQLQAERSRTYYQAEAAGDRREAPLRHDQDADELVAERR